MKKKLLLALLLLLTTGCNPVPTDYGLSSGIKGTRSINGFSALRQTFENANYNCRDVRRLSRRLDTLDTIVWTPQLLGPIDPRMSTWFENWLAQGNHTLVYVVADSGSEADYWTDAQSHAAPDQSLEYRRRAATAINERFRWRLNRVSVSSNGWFQIEPLAETVPIAKIRGAWTQANGITVENDKEPVIELQLTPYKPAPAATTASTTNTTTTNQSNIPTATPANTPPASGATPNSTPNTSTPTTSSPPGPTGQTGPSSYSSLPADPATPTNAKIKFQPLLTAVPPSQLSNTTSGSAKSTSACFVAKVESPQWNNSQIIVISGGSLLSNYSFTKEFARSLADQLVKTVKPPGDSDLQAGFMTSSFQRIPISEVKDGSAMASGMEPWTTWPLSLVMMHALFLGVVTCLILLPIFGRPRRMLRPSLSRFGDHLDAVANLMFRTRGEAYARSRISEYHRRVRGETTGTWVLPETPRPAVQLATQDQTHHPDPKPRD